MKIVMFTFLSVIIVFLVYKCLICGHTMPILGKNAIAEYTTVTLGGVEQKRSIWLDILTEPMWE